MTAELKKQSEDNNALFAPGKDSGVDDQKFNGLVNDLKNFKAEMYKFRDDALNSFKVINDILPKKADKEDL